MDHMAAGLFAVFMLQKWDATFWIAQNVSYIDTIYGGSRHNTAIFLNCVPKVV